MSAPDCNRFQHAETSIEFTKTLTSFGGIRWTLNGTRFNFGLRRSLRGWRGIRLLGRKRILSRRNVCAGQDEQE